MRRVLAYAVFGVWGLLAATAAVMFTVVSWPVIPYAVALCAAIATLAVSINWAVDQL